MFRLGHHEGHVTLASPAGGDGKRQLTWGENFAAGFMAGCASRTFTAPLDVTKILFQLQSGSEGYTSFSGALVKIFKEEGVRGLWKGNVVACLRLGPYSGMKYLTYEIIKDYFTDPATGRIPDGQRAIAGAMAGTMAVITTYPLDLIKTRLTLQKEGVSLTGEKLARTYNGIVDCAIKVIRQEGIGSLYKGIGVTIAGVIPFEAVQFTFYNYIKEERTRKKMEEAVKRGKPEEGKLSTLDFLALGCLAGAVAQTGAYPFDLVRKRFMAQSKAPGMLHTEYKSMLGAFAQIVREEGFLGLYKGTFPNLLKVAPYAAIMWATYEEMRLVIDKLHRIGWLKDQE